MIASTSPSFMAASAAARSARSSSLTPLAAANAACSWVDVADPSWSTQAIVRVEPPPPWKMKPNMKMKISGKARVQKTAARSRR